MHEINFYMHMDIKNLSQINWLCDSLTQKESIIYLIFEHLYNVLFILKHCNSDIWIIYTLNFIEIFWNFDECYNFYNNLLIMNHYCSGSIIIKIILYQDI